VFLAFEEVKNANKECFMKNTIKIPGIIILVMVIGLSIASCDEGEHELVGTWEHVSSYDGGTLRRTLTFNADGTGVQTDYVPGEGVMLQHWSWSTSGSTLIMKFDNGETNSTN